jgi:D-lyxose ketol-isomerase
METGIIETHGKNWGVEEWLVNNELYCGKFLHIEKGKYCSLHYHVKKTEDFYVLKGAIQLDYIWNGDYNAGVKPATMILEQGGVVHIDPLLAHRFTGLKAENILIEISTTHFEDDSYRLEPSCEKA